MEIRDRGIYRIKGKKGCFIAAYSHSDLNPKDFYIGLWSPVSWHLAVEEDYCVGGSDKYRPFDELELIDTGKTAK